MNAYILDTVRTARGKAKPTGGLAKIKPVELLAQLYRALEERNQLDVNEVEDVIIGCVTQVNDQGTSIARVSTLYAGWPEHISGETISRYCASGLAAANSAAARIHAGIDELIVAGGVESVSRVPMLSDNGPLYNDPEVAGKIGAVLMGISADLIATLEGFEREELDRYAVQSHHRAAHARDNGYFRPSLVPIYDDEGHLQLDEDEFIRATTSMEQMAAFGPSFARLGASGMDAIALARYPQLDEIRHLHHRGTSNGMADGAALALIASKEKAHALGIKARARIRAVANYGVEPIIMLTGMIGATKKALARAALTPADIDLWEAYEAFSAPCLKYQREFAIDNEKYNVNGGTIAMGHAFGATGAMMLATLLDEMERRDVELGVVAISGAAGLGTAAVVERV